ncbi:MAG: hypothetical protein OXG68_06110 [Chloroflexi bacterium]|nr:hypothetical protein [Chloroflexota bacterium]
MRKLVVSIPDFDNQVKALSKPKKYPKLPSDLKSFKQKLSTGDIASKRARGVNSAPVFGARVEDSSTGVGKVAVFVFYTSKVKTGTFCCSSIVVANLTLGRQTQYCGY